MYLLGNLVSFVTVKFFENLSTTDNVTITFLDHPVYLV